MGGGGGLGQGVGRVEGVRVDGNGEVKLLRKLKKKKKKLGGGGGGGRGGVRSGVGVGEVARLGVGGDVGYGGCKPGIKGIDKCK